MDKTTDAEERKAELKLKEMSEKKVYTFSKEDMDNATKGNVAIGEGVEHKEATGNTGWKHIAEMVGDEYDILQFEKYFCSWQQQAILLTEIMYAETYTYVTPLGVFTHIGTLARALQHIFEKDWEINAGLISNELSFSVEKGIKGTRYTYVCHFVELDQAYSRMHHDGWKLEQEPSDNLDALIQRENDRIKETWEQSALDGTTPKAREDQQARLKRYMEARYAYTLARMHLKGGSNVPA